MISKYVDLLDDNHLVIFLFHGVIDDAMKYDVRNYTRKHLYASFFHLLVSALAVGGSPLSMAEVVHHVHNRIKYPRKAFAITFDDGFANNFSVAAPILERCKIPAMFYLTTDFVDRNGLSWIDKIEYLLEEFPSGELRLPWDDCIRPFSSKQDRITLLEDIRIHVKSSVSINCNALVDDLYAQLGRQPVTSSSEPIDRKMNWKQVAELARHPLFMVGGHTHTHAIMAYLDDAALHREVALSLELIERHTGTRPVHYSYPEGKAEHYSSRVKRLLAFQGVVCSPTAIPGINSIDSDLFELRRVSVPDPSFDLTVAV